tara:strand:+ start:64 stop:396 length:333 start_codon:yes stop_codon:yes gene_type:complete
MAKRKSPKKDSQTIELTIDGAKVTVPILVEKLLKDQKETIHYLEHVMCLWHYKVYSKNGMKKGEPNYEKELASFIEQMVPTFEERSKLFKETDENNEKKDGNSLGDKKVN